MNQLILLIDVPALVRHATLGAHVNDPTLPAAPPSPLARAWRRLSAIDWPSSRRRGQRYAC